MDACLFTRTFAAVYGVKKVNTKTSRQVTTQDPEIFLRVLCYLRTCLRFYLSTLTMSHFKTFTTKGHKGEQNAKNQGFLRVPCALCGLDFGFNLNVTLSNFPAAYSHPQSCRCEALLFLAEAVCLLHGIASSGHPKEHRGRRARSLLATTWLSSYLGLKFVRKC